MDNKHTIKMEWIIEGVAIIFFGIIVIGSTFIESTNIVSVFNYSYSILVLLIPAIISVFTGYKVNFLPFKLCPYLFSFSAFLILLGILL